MLGMKFRLFTDYRLKLKLVNKNYKGGFIIKVNFREANFNDIDSILRIYNQGIEDRIATLEVDTKNKEYMETWFQEHEYRYKVIVAEHNGECIGWASLNKFNKRKVYDSVADLSIYIERDYRGKGVGTLLLKEIEIKAKENDFYKIVLSTFTFNKLGQQLYRKSGYREVGVYKNQGIIDGKYIDIMIMEKFLED